MFVDNKGGLNYSNSETNNRSKRKTNLSKSNKFKEIPCTILLINKIYLIFRSSDWCENFNKYWHFTKFDKTRYSLQFYLNSVRNICTFWNFAAQDKSFQVTEITMMKNMNFVYSNWMENMMG